MKRHLYCAVGILAVCPALTLAAGPTFTFGPTSKYDKTAVPSATPTSGDILIRPTDLSKGIPSQGLDIYFGPAVASRLADTLKSTACNNGLSENCRPALALAIDKDHAYAVEAAAMGINEAFPGADRNLLQIAAMEGYYIGNNPPGKSVLGVHVESSDLVQAKSQSATSFVYITPSGTAATTVTSVATSTIAGATAAVTTLSADGNGYEKGDVLVTQASGIPALMLSIIKKEGGLAFCGNTTTSKRQAPGRGNVRFAAVNTIATNIMRLAGHDQLFGDFGLPNGANLPVLANTEMEAGVQSVRDSVAKLPGWAGVDAAELTAATRNAYQSVLNFCAYDLPQINVVVFFRLQIKVNVGTNKCGTEPEKWPICDDPACNGLEKGRCTQSLQKDCQCLTYLYPPVHPASLEWWDEGQKVIKGMFVPPTSINLGNLDCGRETDVGNANHWVDLDMLNNAANFFCQKQIKLGVKLTPGAVDPAYKHIDIHYNNNNFDPVYVSMDWLDDPGCPTYDFTANDALKTCQDRLGTIINNCDYNNPTTSKWWKQGGSFFRDCVSWTIKRDTWKLTDGLGGVNGLPDPKIDWAPITMICKGNNDCNVAATVQSCTRLDPLRLPYCTGDSHNLEIDANNSDLGWCKCTNT